MVSTKLICSWLLRASILPLLASAVLLLYLVACPFVLVSHNVISKNKDNYACGGVYKLWEVVNDNTPLSGVMLSWCKVVGVEREFREPFTLRRIKKLVEREGENVLSMPYEEIERRIK